MKKINNTINKDKELKKLAEAIESLFKLLNDQLEKIKPEDILNEMGMNNHAFTRDRKITIPLIIKFVFLFSVSGHKKSILSTNFSLWEYLELNSNAPSRQAMSAAIKNISIEKVEKILLGLEYDFSSHHIKTFHGKKVYTVDGTRCNLPRNAETLEKYGCAQSGKIFSHFPQANILAFHELGTNVIKNIIMGKAISSERKLLLDSLERLELGSIVVCDCGFYSSALAWLIEKMGYFYVIRVNEYMARNLLSSITFVKDTAVIDMLITKTIKNDYETYEKNFPTTVKVRIIRIRGNTRGRRGVYIMTNLWEATNKEIGDLYWDRQRIEDCFKYKKCYGGMEKIHTNSGLHLIEFAILGTIGYHNLMQLVLSKIMKTPKPNENKQYVLNRKVAWENVLPQFFLFSKNGIVKNDFVQLLLRSKNIIRVGRYSPRVLKQPSRKFHKRKANNKNCDDRILNAQVVAKSNIA